MPLDLGAYPSTIFDGRPIPWPEWACKGPDGGVHPSAKVGAIDIDAADAPNSRDEVTWTCDFTVRVVAHSWLSEVEDLIEPGRILLGTLRKDGEALPGWSTIREARPPALRSTEGRTKTCPICGHTYSVVHGTEFFSDPAAFGRPFIANENGLFVREDLAFERNLRTPIGAFPPGIVEFRPPP